MKQTVILNIVFFLFIQNTFHAFNDSTYSEIQNETTRLRTALESIEKHSNISFVYSDNLIQGKFVESFPQNNLSEKIIAGFLDESGVSYKLFSNDTYVLYEKVVEKKAVKLHEKVITNEEFIQKDSSDVILKPVLLTFLSPQYPVDAANSET